MATIPLTTGSVPPSHLRLAHHHHPVVDYGVNDHVENSAGTGGLLGLRCGTLLTEVESTRRPWLPWLGGPGTSEGIGFSWS